MPVVPAEKVYGFSSKGKNKKEVWSKDEFVVISQAITLQPGQTTYSGGFQVPGYDEDNPFDNTGARVLSCSVEGFNAVNTGPYPPIQSMAIAPYNNRAEMSDYYQFRFVLAETPSYEDYARLNVLLYVPYKDGVIA